MKFNYLLLVIIVILSVYIDISVSIDTHRCIYDEVNKHTHHKQQLLDNSKLLNSFNSNNNNGRKTTRDFQQVTLSLNNTQPIRILMYYDSLSPTVDVGYSCSESGEIIENDGNDYTCTADDILSSAQKDYLENTLLSKAKDILSSTLYIERETDPIQITNCADIAIPPEFTSPGVDNIDLVILVTARPIQSQGVLAFGFNCPFAKASSGRARLGQLNFNPKSVEIEETKYNFQFGVALHELSHVLGFNIGTFETANIVTTVAKTTTANNSTLNTQRINSPKVVEFIKNHFNCPSLSSAELEDQGGGGTANSHWEKRIFNNEFMTGTASHYPIFSNLTLALFEDLGFYAINHQYAQQLVWGYGLGCGFSSGKCSSWGNELLYCTSGDNTDTTHCTYDRVAKGACSIRSQTVDPAYQWITGQAGDELPDYCPWYEGYSDAYCVDNTIPDDKSLVLKTFEVYGPNSRCFVSSLLKNAPSLEGSKATCYPSACQSVNNLKIKVSSYWYDCPYGEDLEVEGFQGSLACPDGNELCINVPVDNEWPIFISISPDSAGPGDEITIIGENFNNSTYIDIAEKYCDNVVVVNSTYITATLSEDYADITNLIEKSVNVYVVNKDTDKNDIGTINFKIPPSSVLNWAKSHWYIILIGVLVAAGAIAFVVRCCCSSRKNNDFSNKQSRLRS